MTPEEFLNQLGTHIAEVNRPYGTVSPMGYKFSTNGTASGSQQAEYKALVQEVGTIYEAMSRRSPGGVTYVGHAARELMEKLQLSCDKGWPIGERIPMLRELRKQLLLNVDGEDRSRWL